MVDDVLLLVFVIGVDMAMVQLMMRRCRYCIHADADAADSDHPDAVFIFVRKGSESDHEIPDGSHDW